MLTGTTIYQSFVGGVVGYRSLDKASFRSLQRNIFPVYFGLQTALPLLLYLTRPPHVDVIPFAAMGLSALANLVAVGPWASKVMMQRVKAEEREGKSRSDPNISDELKGLNKQFGQAHGLSTLINFGTIGSILWYGIILSERLV